MPRFSSLIKNKNFLSEKPSVFNINNQVASLTDDLNSRYINNNGCLINIFTYNNNSNNIYLYHFHQFFKRYFSLLNKPQVIISNRLNFNDTDNSFKQSYTLNKSIFNNIPMIINFIETLGTLDIDKIKLIYENAIKLDTQGNFPSIFLPLFTEQIDIILNNNIIQGYYQNRIPIVIPYGYASSNNLHKKYIYDLSNSYNVNRTIESYILNMGPCTLDYISAMFNFYKLKKLHEYYGDDNTRFRNQSFSNKYNLEYWDSNMPNYTTSRDTANEKYLQNYQPYAREYILDLSNNYIFYIGIDTSYGWTCPIEYLRHITSEIYEISLDSYDSENDIDVVYRKSNIGKGITETNYNDYIDTSFTSNFFNRFSTNSSADYYENFFKNNTLDISLTYFNEFYKKNPKIVAIKIPYFQTSDDILHNNIGSGIQDAWSIIDNIITQYSLDLSNVGIFIQSFGQNSDYKTLEFLYENNHRQYIPITIGSQYEFLEQNFIDISNSNSNSNDTNAVFDGLMSVKPYNAFAPQLINIIDDIIEKQKNQIDLNNIFTSMDNFDQFKFFEILVILYQLGYYNLATILVNGTQANSESLDMQYKIPTGHDIFSNNNPFDFKSLYESQSVNLENGISQGKFLFQGLIGSHQKHSEYLNIDNGYPFNRNTTFTLYKRCFYGPRLLKNNIKIDYRYYPNFENTYTYNPLFISSEIELINSIIFKLNDHGSNSTMNSNLYLDRFLENFNNNSVIVSHDDEVFSVIKNIKLNSSFKSADSYFFANFPNNYTRINIKELLIGNDFTSFENYTDLSGIEKITIGKNIPEIQASAFKNCTGLSSVNFILDPTSYNSSLQIINSYSFYNCISLNKIVIPNSVLEVRDFAFAECSDLSTVILSNNLADIHGSSFKDCVSLSSIVFPNSLHVLGDNAFENCNFLQNIGFEENSIVNDIGSECFKNCSSLGGINIPSSITHIGNSCFENCTSITDIVLSNNTSIIGSKCFKDCSMLENINTQDTSLVILSQEIFANCNKLQKCILPASVNTIDNLAFENCTDLSYILINGTITDPIPVDIFNNVGHNVNIYYFSNLTPVQIFDNIVTITNDTNGATVTLIDLFNTIPEYITTNYYSDLNIEQNNEFFMNPIIIDFYLENYKLDISYNFSTTQSFVDTAIIGQYNINYNVNYFDNSSVDFSLNTVINIFETLNNKPTIELYGNSNLYINSPSAFIEYGYTAVDHLNNDLSLSVIDNVTNLESFEYYMESATGKVYFVYYYAVDSSYNYWLTKRNVYFYDDFGISRRNLKADVSYCSFNIYQDNGVYKAKLYLKFLNDGNMNFDTVLQSTSVQEVTMSKFLFPIFNVSSDISDSADLTGINGPPSLQKYTYDNSDYYFVNRLNYKILNGSTMKIIRSYNTYEKVFKEIYDNSFVYEQSWGLNKGLRANDFVEIEIVFNYFGTCDDILANMQISDIFTSESKFAIFLDNGTSSFIDSSNSLRFYDKGYFNEMIFVHESNGLMGSDLYKSSGQSNLNDNVYQFHITNINRAFINGPSYLKIERGSYFKDLGAMYIGASDSNFIYNKWPSNTYDSSNIILNNGIYDISYVILPYGDFGITDYNTIRFYNSEFQMYIYDLSRSIEIVDEDSNYNKPTIILGDPSFQTIMVHTFPKNNFMNYAYDISGNELPIFKELLTQDLSLAGTYYEYFYTYDNAGNYASKIRTISVVNS